MYYYGIHKVNDCETMDPDYIGSGVGISAAIKKHGKSAFHRTVLLEFDDAHSALDWEARMVTTREVDDPLCYNRKLGGGSGGGHSEASKVRMSVAKKGKKIKPRSEEHMANLRAAWDKRGPLSEEHRKKLYDARMNRGPVTDKTKKKMSVSQKKRHAKSPMSEETRARISASLAGRKRQPHTEETKAKMSVSQRERRRRERE